MNTNTRAIPELSVDTQTIERLLLAVAVGDTITYVELTAAIGRDVQHAARHVLTSARRRVLGSARAVFEPVVDIGLKRLDDVGKIGAGRWHLSRARRQAQYAARKASAVDNFEALPNAQKIEHNVVLAQAGVMRHFTSAKSTNKLATAMTSPKHELLLRDSLKALQTVL